MDNTPYYTVRGGKYDGYFHPKKLPRELPKLSAVYSVKSNKPPPAQRTLSMIGYHRRWLACLERAKLADATTPHVSTLYREATRFIGGSQEGAGAPFDISPDGSYATKIPSLQFEVLGQRRGGLDLAVAKTFNDSEALRLGHEVDRKGDEFANNGDRNRKHNRTLNAGERMLSAVAAGQVVKGDKEDPESAALYNEGYILDLAEVGGDEETGADVLYEFKVPSPLTKSHVVTGKSPKHGGVPASVGHLYAFGNTEEKFRLKVLGCKGRGRRRDGSFDHKTGRGWVKAVKGDYFDAIVRKGSRVVPMIIETTGGIAPHSRAVVARLARRARRKGGRDGTVYGASRTSTRSFYVHHIQQMSLAAQKWAAAAIVEEYKGRRLQRGLAGDHRHGAA
jgi:hypothetical protein